VTGPPPDYPDTLVPTVHAKDEWSDAPEDIIASVEL